MTPSETVTALPRPASILACLLLLLYLSPRSADGQSAKPQAGQSGFNWSSEFGKSPAQFSRADWAPIIDATWGSGLATSSKLRLWDTWWNDINLKFGGHHGIDLDLVAMRSRYRPEIAAGVSKGRFSGIMNHFTFQLQELHTYLWDGQVRNTTLNKGIPIFVIGHYGNNRRFGALLSVLPDSTLLVYESVPNHPIGLVAGDLVLGYDGVAWKDIYPALLEAELPLLLNPVHANTPEANYHYLMQAAGLNWHLFDTIDVVKYATGDTLHFPTSSLAGQSATIWGKDQIAPPGVPWPDRSQGDRVGWGVISGTNIGMVTVTSWAFDAQFDIRARFETAVDELMHTHDVDGIIFDFRFNTGGGALAREGLQLLFNERVPTVGFDRRVVGTDPFAMEPDPSRTVLGLTIQGDASTYFDKPIAILVGPGSISAGELEARRMSFHPEARVFGLPAASGNTGSDFISIGDSNWFVSRANSTQYFVSNHEYLTRKPLTPDAVVWFDRDDAANGVDTVIRAAQDWIESETTSIEPGENPAGGELVLQIYPNPSAGELRGRISLDDGGQVTASLYDILGRHLATTWDGYLSAGRHELLWDLGLAGGGQVTPGLYFWRVESGGRSSVLPVVLRN